MHPPNSPNVENTKYGGNKRTYLDIIFSISSIQIVSTVVKTLCNKAIRFKP